MLKCFFFSVTGISISEKKNIKQNFKLFLHMLLKIEIIWMWTNQVIR